MAIRVQSSPPPERVLLAEWGTDAGPSLADGLHRQPCPICNHPTGDCTTHITIEPDPEV